MRLITSILAAAVLTLPGYARAQCRGLAAVSTISKDQLPSLQEKAKAGGCSSSYASVIGKLMNRETTAGRRLEKARPFNPATAQANVDAALRNPDVRKRIDALRSEVPDETVRLLHEAAVFDEEGFYDARELRIHQLRQRLN